MKFDFARPRAHGISTPVRPADLLLVCGARENIDVAWTNFVRLARCGASRYVVGRVVIAGTDVTWFTSEHRGSSYQEATRLKKASIGLFHRDGMVSYVWFFSFCEKSLRACTVVCGLRRPNPGHGRN
jgi:hypothetical protein